MSPLDYQNSLLKKCELEKLDLTVIAMIMGQCEFESMGFHSMQESFKYNSERLIEVFKSRVATISFADALIKLGEQEIANFVYAGRMGNGPRESGDGYRFRGRTPIQLTGRDNYIAAQAALGIALIKDPDLALFPDNASAISVAYFVRKPWLMKCAAAGDVLGASSWINLGHYRPGSSEKPNGLEQRGELFRKWLQKLK